MEFSLPSDWETLNSRISHQGDNFWYYLNLSSSTSKPWGKDLRKCSLLWELFPRSVLARGIKTDKEKKPNKECAIKQVTDMHNYRAVFLGNSWRWCKTCLNFILPEGQEHDLSSNCNPSLAEDCSWDGNFLVLIDALNVNWAKRWNRKWQEPAMGTGWNPDSRCQGVWGRVSVTYSSYSGADGK